MIVTDKSDQIVGDVYFHINNGGVNINVIDCPKGGPTIIIESEHFGHKTAGIELHVHPDMLKEIADMFSKAAEYKFKNKPHIFAIGGPRDPIYPAQRLYETQ